ncbi:Cupredoxin, partial [Jimgerdemannia flammicorona]
NQYSLFFRSLLPSTAPLPISSPSQRHLNITINASHHHALLTAYAATTLPSRRSTLPPTANTGNLVRIRVRNELQEPTALHWHGMFLRGVPWLDGVPGQTQCPIPADKEYTYEFRVNGQCGTYWWHSHFMAQYVNGMVGAFIIHNPKMEPFRKLYDEEYTVLLSDWYALIDTPRSLLSSENQATHSSYIRFGHVRYHNYSSDHRPI